MVNTREELFREKRVRFKWFVRFVNWSSVMFWIAVSFGFEKNGVMDVSPLQCISLHARMNISNALASATAWDMLTANTAPSSNI